MQNPKELFNNVFNRKKTPRKTDFISYGMIIDPGI